MLRDVLSEVGRNCSLALVVACQAVDTALDKNQTEFCVLVRSIGLQMLADRHSFLDEVVQVLGHFGGQTWNKSSLSLPIRTNRERERERAHRKKPKTKSNPN